MLFAVSLANDVFAKTKKCIHIQDTNTILCVGDTAYWGPWNYLSDGTLDMNLTIPYLSTEIQKGKIIGFNKHKFTALISSTHRSLEMDVRHLYLCKNFIEKVTFRIGDVVSFETHPTLSTEIQNGKIIGFNKVKSAVLISSSEDRCLEMDVRNLDLCKNLTERETFSIGDVVSFKTRSMNDSQGVILAAKNEGIFGNFFIVKDNNTGSLGWLYEKDITFIKKAWNARWLVE